MNSVYLKKKNMDYRKSKPFLDTFDINLLIHCSFRDIVFSGPDELDLNSLRIEFDSKRVSEHPILVGLWYNKRRKV
jgi:hypothetical protein